MPHIPHNFRPPPPGAIGVGTATKPPDVPVTNVPPIADKPTVKKQPSPRRRTFGKKTKMRTFMSMDDIAEWDVSPEKIHKAMKLGGS
jgi:hypothetical protein